MDREQVKKWLLDNTESIEQTDIEKQSMLGEDVIDLMVDLVKNNDLLHNVSGCFSFAKYFKENYKFWKYTKDNKETYQSEISGKIMTEAEIFEHWKSNKR